MKLKKFNISDELYTEIIADGVEATYESTGNLSGEIPVSNGILCSSLNADMVDSCDVETALTNGTDKIPRSDAVKTYIDGRVPVGSIIMYGNSTPPANYLICNGASLPRADYPLLFAAIGTSYNPGAPSTHFNIPNYSAVSPMGTGNQYINGRLKVGPGFAALQEDQMQIITGYVNMISLDQAFIVAASGAFSADGNTGKRPTGGDTATRYQNLYFNSGYSSGARTHYTFGEGDYTRGNTLGTTFCIRYQ